MDETSWQILMVLSTMQYVGWSLKQPLRDSHFWGCAERTLFFVKAHAILQISLSEDELGRDDEWENPGSDDLIKRHLFIGLI